MSDPKVYASAAYRQLIKGGRKRSQARTRFMAQIDTWYKILDLGVPAAIVLDKDAEVPKNFLQLVDTTFAQTLGNYETFDMWLFNQREDILKANYDNVSGVALVDAFQGMYGYLITRRGILRILPHILSDNAPLSAIISRANSAYEIDIVYTPRLTVRRPSEYKEMFENDTRLEVHDMMLIKMASFVLLMGIIVVVKHNR